MICPVCGKPKEISLTAGSINDQYHNECRPPSTYITKEDSYEMEIDRLQREIARLSSALQASENREKELLNDSKRNNQRCD